LLLRKACPVAVSAEVAWSLREDEPYGIFPMKTTLDGGRVDIVKTYVFDRTKRRKRHKGPRKPKWPEMVPGWERCVFVAQVIDCPKVASFLS
jgi:hypothetical protein